MRSYYSPDGPFLPTAVRVDGRMRNLFFRVQFTTVQKVYYCLVAYNDEGDGDLSDTFEVVKQP